MPEIEINGISVNFPFEPYVVQRDYMAKVIEALREKRHAILESPTGTGKTLSLLCATLGWIEEQKMAEQMNGRNQEREMERENGVRILNERSPRQIPLVVYSTRTHTQITQAMKELKNSAYNYMKAGVIASRDQLCIHDGLQKMSNTEKTYMCKALMAKKKPTDKCCYYENLKSRSAPTFENTILDIEELGRIGREFDICPLYVSKDLIKQADIVFMPYNYLLDPKVRRYTQIELSNSIIILDEGHNVEKMCEDSACAEIDSTKIRIATRDMEYIIKHWNWLDGILSLNQLIELAKCIEMFQMEVLNIAIESPVRGDAQPGDYIFALLEKARITESSFVFIREALNSIVGILVEKSRLNETTKDKCPQGIGLRALMGFLIVVFSSSAPHLRDRVKICYKVFNENEPDKLTADPNTVEKAEVNAKKINFWCFSAAFGMQHLLQRNIRNLILTSGTLAPLKPLITEMEIHNPVQLTNPHIIKDFQIFVKVVDKDPKNVSLNSNFKNRYDAKYLDSLGQTIIEFSKVVPDGLLVFFPSYPVMSKCLQHWQTKGIWRVINDQKRIFLESKIKTEFDAAMQGYYDCIKEENSKGAIFMAVMRGKVSEGLDFADMYGRAVIITGIPYAPCKEPKVMLKKKYLDENRTVENEMLSGHQYYVLDAVRAINQAIGRVIRHKDDYGAILLCDERFHYKNVQKDISDWIKAHLCNSPECKEFNSIVANLRSFYQKAEQKLPKPERGREVYFDAEEQVSIVELPANDDADMNVTHPLDDSHRIDFDKLATNFNNNNNESTPMKRNVNTEIGPTRSLVNTSPFKRLKIDDAVPSTSYDQNINIPKVSNAGQLPAGLIDNLAFIKTQASYQKYDECIKTFIAYYDTSNYEAYRDSLFSIFNEMKWTYILNGMVRYTKPDHKVLFECAIKKLSERIL